MRQRLYHRLQELETQHARELKARGAPDEEALRESAHRKIRLFLHIRGIEQTAKESLADAFSRALEIRGPELRQMLMAGVNPIRKYFTEHGVYEEIERRKAAGTWPSGSTVEDQNVRI
jgi:ATP sulfurylase